MEAWEKARNWDSPGAVGRDAQILPDILSDTAGVWTWLKGTWEKYTIVVDDAVVQRGEGGGG